MKCGYRKVSIGLCYTLLDTLLDRIVCFHGKISIQISQQLPILPKVSKRSNFGVTVTHCVLIRLLLFNGIIGIVHCKLL